MAEMRRRDFLKSGTMAVAAAGVAAADPIVPAVVNVVDAEGPEVDSAATAIHDGSRRQHVGTTDRPGQRPHLGLHADVLRNSRGRL